MKKLLIASATVAAISLGGFALAQPAGPGMRHHEPVKEIVKHLRGLSLSDAQREEIKTLVSAFKDANPRVEYQDSEKPDFDFELNLKSVSRNTLRLRNYATIFLTC